MTPTPALALGPLSVERRPGRYRYETTRDAGRLVGAAATIAVLTHLHEAGSR